MSRSTEVVDNVTARPTIASVVQHELRGHKGAILNVRFNRPGTYCISTGQDRTLRLWNPHRGVEVKEYKGPHNHEVNDVAIFADNSRFASVAGDPTAYLWDVASGHIIRKFVGHSNKVNCCALNATDEVLITGGYDKSVRIWDMRAHNAFKPVQVLTDARDAISSLIVTSHEILSGSVDGSVRCYDIRAGKLCVDEVHYPVTSMSLSSDEQYILVGCLDSGLRLLDRSTGLQLNSFRGHKNSNYRLHASLDPVDSYAVCGSEDGKLCFWDVATDEPMKMLETMDTTWGCIFCVRFHPEQHLMLCGSNDRVLRVLRPAEGLDIAQ